MTETIFGALIQQRRWIQDLRWSVWDVLVSHLRSFYISIRLSIDSISVLKETILDLGLFSNKLWYLLLTEPFSEISYCATICAQDTLQPPAALFLWPQKLVIERIPLLHQLGSVLFTLHQGTNECEPFSKGIKSPNTQSCFQWLRSIFNAALKSSHLRKPTL